MVMKKFFLIVALFCLLVNMGCSVHRAANQPDEKDLSLLSAGTPRGKLLAEFGAPLNSEIIEGKRTDIFKFVQGYSTATKSSRAFFHGAADVMTLGLWELVGTPVEGAYSGDEMAFSVKYDENDRVLTVEPLDKVSEEGISEVNNPDNKPQEVDCDSSIGSC